MSNNKYMKARGVVLSVFISKNELECVCRFVKRREKWQEQRSRGRRRPDISLVGLIKGARRPATLDGGGKWMARALISLLSSLFLYGSSISRDSITDQEHLLQWPVTRVAF